MKNKDQSNKNAVESQYKNIGSLKVLHTHFLSIDSTNTWAKLNVDKWLKEGITLVTASEQTGGRGRFKRVWISPKDQNIYATFCIVLDELRQDIGQIPQLMALSACQVLENYGISSTIKWPNDVLVEGKKIAGILCETTSHEGKIGFVCGIGLNVNMTAQEAACIDQPAYSMYLAKKHSFDVQEVINQLLEQFVKNWQLFLQQGFMPFLDEFKKHSYYCPGQDIYVSDGQKKFSCKFVQLNDDGTMSVLLSNGKIIICTSGEILF